MSRILLAYITGEGQTARVANCLAETFQRQGHTVEIGDIREMPEYISFTGVDGIVIGASIHRGHYPGELMKFVKKNLDKIEQMPSAFFTICLSAASEQPEDQVQAQAYVEQVIDETNWRPEQAAAFAGALQYSKYGLIKRYILRSIAKRQGNDTDMSHDYEYTDWQSVEQFADTFVTTLESVEPLLEPA